MQTALIGQLATSRIGELHQAAESRRRTAHAHRDRKGRARRGRPTRVSVWCGERLIAAGCRLARPGLVPAA